MQSAPLAGDRQFSFSDLQKTFVLPRISATQSLEPLQETLFILFATAAPEMHGGAFVINGNVYTTLVHASHAQAEVCDERRQGRRADDFLESRMILLQQEAGMGYCTAMKRVPYADIRENKEGLAVHFREGQRRFVGQWVILWQTEKQFLRTDDS